MGLTEDRSNLIADEALEEFSTIQAKLPYGIASIIGNALGKLKNLEEAEQGGRLLELPCKISSRIYEANKTYGKVFQRFASKEDMLTKIMPGWGKRYFGTPEEAEKSLETEPRN